MNSRENKRKNKNSKFFKGKCNKFGNYGHRASDCWVNSNKNDNINNSKTARNTRFNRECKNCKKTGHKAFVCWSYKLKEKYDDVDNLFVVSTFCVEVQEENNEEDP